MKRFFTILTLFVALNYSFSQLSIVDRDPRPNAINVPRDANIRITFDKDVEISTLAGNILVIGSFSGLYSFTFSYDASTKTLILDPRSDFKYNELITVEIKKGVKSTSDDSLTQTYIWSFTVEVKGGSGNFVEKTRIGVGSSPYGLSFGDIDGDGDVDIAVANWSSHNVSILMNDGSGN
ncbi:Repeat domain-containing protein, partial [Candidatus Thermokryptus mobilis]